MKKDLITCSGCLSEDDPTARERRYIHTEYAEDATVVWCEECVTESARFGFTFPTEEKVTTEDDFTDPTFVLGAVLAQVEDLNPSDKRAVLRQALATVFAKDYR